MSYKFTIELPMVTGDKKWDNFAKLLDCTIFGNESSLSQEFQLDFFDCNPPLLEFQIVMLCQGKILKWGEFKLACTKLWVNV